MVPRMETQRIRDTGHTDDALETTEAYSEFAGRTVIPSLLLIQTFWDLTPFLSETDFQLRDLT